MKRVIISTICLLLGLPLLAVVADLDGVRGVQWGAGPGQVRQVFAQTGAQIIDRGGWLEIIPKSGPVGSEQYYFLKGKLYKVYMAYNLAPNAVLDYFSNQYGKPVFENNHFWWNFPSTTASIERGSSSIWYQSRDIKEETRQESTPQQSDDPHQNIMRVDIGMTVAQVTQLMGNPVGKRVGNSLATVIFTYRTGEIVFTKERVVEIKLSQAVDEGGSGVKKKIFRK